MKNVHDVPEHAYMNVMELLVTEEVEKQLQIMQPRMLKYLKRVEVETYALNRLPSLYASSEKGWQHQYEKAKRELHNQIKSAVRQAFAAVQVDPIRSSQPLQAQQETETAKAALDTLREMLKQPDLSWEGVVNRLRSALGYRSPDQSPTGLAPESSHRTRYHGVQREMTSTERTDGSHSHYWRPGTYGGEVSSWQKRNPNSASPNSGSPNSAGEIDFDWSDSRYSK